MKTHRYSSIKMWIADINILLVIIFLLIAVGSNLWFQHTAKENQQRHSQTQLSSMISTVSSQYDKMENILVQLSNNKELILYAIQYQLETNANTFFKALDVMNQLNLVRQSVSDILEIYVWFPTSDWVIDTRGTTKKDAIFKSVFPKDEKEITSICEDPNRQNTLSILNVRSAGTNSPYQNTSLWIYPTNYFSILIKVDIDETNDLLSRITTFDSGIVRVTVGATNVCLAEYARDFSNGSFQQVVAQPGKAPDNRNYLVSDYEDTERNLKYVTMYSRQELIQQITQINLVTLSLFLVLMLVSFLIFIFLKSKFYKPIKKIINTAAPFSIPSSGNEFFVLDHIVTALKTNINSFETEKKTLENELRNMQISLVASGFNMEIENSDMKQPYEAVCYIVISCIMDDAQGELDQSYLSLIEKRLDEYFLCRKLFIDSKVQTYLLAFQEESAYRNQLDRVFKDDEQADGFCLVGVSRPANDILQVRESYLESQMSMLHSAGHGVAVFSRITHYEDIKSQNADTYEFTLEAQRALVNQAALGNTEKVQKSLSDILTQNENKNYLQQKALCHCLLSLTQEVVLTKGSQENDRIDSTCLENLKGMNNLKLFIGKLKTLLLEATNRVRDNKQELTELILKYIDENFHLQISLESLEEEVGMSYGHISRTFRKEIGMTLINYLQMKRLEKAKELMKENRAIRVNQVAEKVGFQTVGNFIKLFKKFEGITPSEYIKKSAEDVRAQAGVQKD